MSGQHGMPTASVVRSSQATPARRRGHPCAAFNPAAFHLSSPDSCSNRWGHLCSAGPNTSASASSSSRCCGVQAARRDRLTQRLKLRAQGADLGQDRRCVHSHAGLGEALEIPGQARVDERRRARQLANSDVPVLHSMRPFSTALGRHRTHHSARDAISESELRSSIPAHQPARQRSVIGQRFRRREEAGS